jgi:Mg/Co/Ni transporter MgtE
MRSTTGRAAAPADIADLFELTDEDERLALAKAINDLMSVEVIAELNDYVRELLVEELPPTSSPTSPSSSKPTTRSR